MTRSRRAGPERQTDGRECGSRRSVFLHEQGQAIEALAHVRVARGEPHPHTGRNRDHRRPARMPSTATMVARSTGPAIRTRPPAHSTSTTPPRLSSGGRGVSTGEGSTSGTKAGAGRAFGGLLLLPQFTPPPEQKARGDPVPARHGRDRARGPLRLINNGALLPSRPGSARAGHHRV